MTDGLEATANLLWVQKQLGSEKKKKRSIVMLDAHQSSSMWMKGNVTEGFFEHHNTYANIISINLSKDSEDFEQARRLQQSTYINAIGKVKYRGECGCDFLSDEE